MNDKVIIDSIKVVSNIESTNELKDRLRSQANSTLLQIMDPQFGGDPDLRLQCTDCLDRINYALKELNGLDGSYGIKDTGIYEWLNTAKVDLLRYVPPVLDSITTPEGITIPSEVNDSLKVIKLFKPFTGTTRGMILNHSDVYDDDYLLKRVITNTTNTYKNVLDDVWENRWLRKSYTRVVADQNTTTRETNALPFLPGENSFKDLVTESSSITGLMSDVLLARTMMTESPGNLFEYMSLTPEEIRSGKPFIFMDPTGSKEWAERALGLISSALIYEIDKDHYAVLIVRSKEIFEMPDRIRPEYYDNYYKIADENVRHYVYNNCKDYYFSGMYGLKLTCDIMVDSLGYSPDKIFPVYKPVKAYDNIVKELCGKSLKDMEQVKSIYGACPAHLRCEDKNIDKQYEEACTFFSRCLTNTILHSTEILRYITNDLQNLINNRITNLKEFIIDPNNISRLLGLLQKRLTKSESDLLIWYQSIVQLDETYNNYLNSYKLCKDSSKGLLINNVYTVPGDNNLWFNYPNGKVIDLDDPYEVYNNERFKSGDSVYIIKDDYNIQENRISNVSNIEIDSNSYVNGSLEKKKLVRLNLVLSLEKWCYTEGTIKVAKVK